MFQLFGHSLSFPRVLDLSATNTDTFRDRDLVLVDPTIINIVYPPEASIQGLVYPCSVPSNKKHNFSHNHCRRGSLSHKQGGLIHQFGVGLVATLKLDYYYYHNPQYPISPQYIPTSPNILTLICTILTPFINEGDKILVKKVKPLC